MKICKAWIFWKLIIFVASNNILINIGNESDEIQGEVFKHIFI